VSRCSARSVNPAGRGASPRLRRVEEGTGAADRPEDDLEKLARFIDEVEQWRVSDEISDERRDVAKAV
jgi:hypothetical protein